jgi:hypothetical protein
MTETGLALLLDLWKKRLGLESWIIEMKVGEIDEPGSYMEVDKSTQYERAVLYVAPFTLGAGDVPKEALAIPITDEFVEASLVHELLHLVLRDVTIIVRQDLDGSLHPYALEQVQNAAMRAEERVVDKLAVALVRSLARPSSDRAATTRVTP